jgi:hypothetical protein
MVKPALFAPAATVTVSGTLAIAPLLLASLIAAPPDGAGPVRITVPPAGLPPITVVGFNVSDESETVTGIGVGVGVGLGVGVGVGIGVGPIFPIFKTNASSC